MPNKKNTAVRRKNMRDLRDREKRSGGHSRAFLGPSRQSFSPAERHIGRDGGPA